MKRWLLLLSILAFTPVVFAQEEFKVVARWSMNGSGGTVVEDATGRGNDGQLRGQAAFVADPMMPAIEISGPDGYMAVPHSEDLEPARGGVELWIKPAVLKDVDVFNKLTFYTLRSGLHGGKAVYGIHLLADGTIAGYILNDGMNPAWRIWSWVSSPRPVITAGQWHHVVLQWDGRQVTLHVNGRQVAQDGYNEVLGLGLSYSRESEFTLGNATRWFGNDDHQFIGCYGETRVFEGSMPNEEIRRRSQHRE